LAAGDFATIRLQVRVNVFAASRVSIFIDEGTGYAILIAALELRRIMWTVLF